MKTRIQTFQKNVGGYALAVTMAFIAVSMLLLASALHWTATESGLTARNNLYNITVAAAEAGTERVLAQMDRDFIYQSVNTDLTNSYGSLTPDQSTWPSQFEFSDGAGGSNRTSIHSLGAQVVANLDSEFAGLYGLVSPFQVSSQARALNQPYPVAARVSQDFQLARVPIFQFAIFYAMDLEINPGAAMIVTGKVHSNGDIYTAPPASLTYNDAVMATGQIYNNRHPDDPTTGGKTTPVFNGKHVDKVSSLTLPIATNNSPDAVQQLLDVPPWNEDRNSDLGRLRYYNNADLIITNSPGGNIIVSSGAWNNFAILLADVGSGTNSSYSFVTNVSFYDYREQKTVKATELDVTKFRTWITNTAPNGGSGLNNLAKSSMNHELNSLYVIDKRPQTSTVTSGVRVSNARLLPADGLTVATPQPIYVKGHFNLNNDSTTAGLTNTSQTEAAALIGDAVTLLSENWSDAYNSGTGLSSRSTVNTTVNAALLAGIVKSTHVGNTKYYSGGVENFPRFLENWSGSTLTYNGSMVVMYPSRSGTNYWIAPGTYYNAPTRKWAFDVNFLDPNRLPPLTPQVRKLVRGQWKVLAAN